MALKYCPKCRQQIPVNIDICPFCGSRIQTTNWTKIGLIGLTVILTASIVGSINDPAWRLLLFLLFIIGGLTYYYVRLVLYPDGKPPSPNAIRITSHDTGIKYWVDMVALTCSCPDWRERRAGFEKTDPGRLCKHLIRTLDQHGFCPASMENRKDEYRALIDSGKGYPRDPNKLIVTSEGAAFVYPGKQPSSAGYMWINIYFNEDKFGFCSELGKWSYGRQPDVADEILKKYFNLPDSLPENAITTVRRIKQEKSMLKVLGEVEGEEVVVMINPRAKWQTIEFNGLEIKIHRERGDFTSESTWKIGHLKSCMLAWVRKEFDFWKDYLKESQNITNTKAANAIKKMP